MAARKADGAGLDFEPVGALAARAPQFVAFVARFRAAMKKRFPDAQLVNATSAGATEALVKGIEPYVDRQMIMTYNYRWSGSTITGASRRSTTPRATSDPHPEDARLGAGRVAADGRAVLRLRLAVTGTVPNAKVQSDKKTYGA